MGKRHFVIVMTVLALALPGCALKEVRSNTRFGPSFRHKASNRTDSVRWMVQQGIQLRWKNGIRTGISYRRRDTDDGNGDNDNGVFLNVSLPVWKAPKKPDPVKKRMKKLEKRVKELEMLLKQTGGPQ